MNKNEEKMVSKIPIINNNNKEISINKIQTQVKVSNEPKTILKDILP